SPSSPSTHLYQCVFHRPMGCSHENEYTGWYSVWGPGRARLNAQGFGCAWLALHQDAQQWVKIDVDGARFVSGIIVQGRCDADEWVTKFALDYRSESHQKWICCKDHNGNNRVFYGNTDRSGSVQSLLRPPVMASSLRVRPLRWHSRIALRLEVLECLTKCASHLLHS
uniref:Retinoschisin 1 n=1 Tax=Eptatretus burgeri TaxID=7764 RepID=A0A8C4R890_EPTBU